MNLIELLKDIDSLPDCRVYPSANHGILVRDGLTLPSDVQMFYNLCDGVDLFMSSDYPYSVVPSAQFVPVNPVVMGKNVLQIVGKHDISNDWYIVARDPDRQYLTIDLNPQRVGRCYDSFIGRHAVATECEIIAKSFTDLLSHLVRNQGGYPYWLQDTFKPLGPAYEGW